MESSICFLDFDYIFAEIVDVFCIVNIDIESSDKHAGIGFDIHFINIYAISFGNDL